jgi:hypothetical protein
MSFSKAFGGVQIVNFLNPTYTIRSWGSLLKLNAALAA